MTWKEIRESVSLYAKAYGKGNEKVLRKKCISIGIMMMIMFTLFQIVMPAFFSNYFNVIKILVVLNLIVTYFYKKDTNTNKYRKIKTVVAMVSYIVLLIVFSPIILAYNILTIFADITKKLFLLKKYPFCFGIEVICHLTVTITIVQETISNRDRLLVLVVTYIVMIMFDQALCNVFRIALIRGNNKYYERYCYKMEINVVSEYIFLVTTTISILCSTAEYEYVFLPMLLWYSLKQIRKFHIKKKNSSLKKKFLLKILNILQELNEVYIDNMEGEFIVSEFISALEIEVYKKYNLESPLWEISKKSMDRAMNAIKEFHKQKYKLPREKVKLREDLEQVLNFIARCI